MPAVPARDAYREHRRAREATSPTTCRQATTTTNNMADQLLDQVRDAVEGQIVCILGR